MNDTISALHLQNRAEAEVQGKILALVFSKPLEQLVAIPKEWKQCSHVDLQTDKLWPDMEREITPMVGNLVSYLAHRGKIPVDVCVVRSHGVFSLVVRTEEIPAMRDLSPEKTND